MDNKLKTPILFLVFNRLNTVRRVFETIKSAKPLRLYIAADGPREGVAGEKGKTCEVRDYVLKNIDWPCKVKTLFRDENLGCKVAVSSAIDWFFKNEEMGIILEDDCLPSQSFFWFCEELLAKYKDDERIMQISGFNPLNTAGRKESYLFSKYGSIWGWATWKRAWVFYDIHMKSWPFVRENKWFRGFCDSKREEKWRINLFNRVYSSKLETWDFQWVYAKLKNGGLSVVPKINLIENIGFGKDSTHTKFNPSKFQSNKGNIEFPLKFVLHSVRDMNYDKAYFKKVVEHSVFERILSLLKLIGKRFKEMIWLKN